MNWWITSFPARRIIRELIDLKYPLVIFDPHGDYLGFFEKLSLFKDTCVRIFYPMIRVRERNLGIVADLIDKMGRKLTEAQQQFYQYLVSVTDMTDGEAATDYIQRLIDHASNIAGKQRRDEHVPDEISNIRGTTINAAKRSSSPVLRIAPLRNGATSSPSKPSSWMSVVLRIFIDSQRVDGQQISPSLHFPQTECADL